MSELDPILAEYLTVDQLAVELNRNKRTLDRWEKLRIGPPRTHLGRTVLYHRNSVREWLAKQEHGPPKPKTRAAKARPEDAPIGNRRKTIPENRPRHVGKRRGSQPSPDRQRPG